MRNYQPYREVEELEERIKEDNNEVDDGEEGRHAAAEHGGEEEHQRGNAYQDYAEDEVTFGQSADFAVHPASCGREEEEQQGDCVEEIGKCGNCVWLKVCYHEAEYDERREVQEGDEGNAEPGGLCLIHGVYATILRIW